jgi:hypothetical protein
MTDGGPSRSTSRRTPLRPLLWVLAVAAVTVVSFAALPAIAGVAASTPAAHSAGTTLPATPAKASGDGSRPAALPAPRAPTSWVTPHVAFHVAGTHPGSWGSAVPPGAPTPVSASGTGSGGYNYSGLYQECYGIWPSQGGQSQYWDNCYGHDEPDITPYSNLPGSGGNVTWQLQLPVDRSPTANQSNLYSAIWFGLTLNDPYAWMNQCFLELQFYPDASWSVPDGTVNGQWTGAAVAWQIQASSGSEDPCFYTPLMLQGSAGTFFSMTQGDTINVTMTGWTGSATGENVTITDSTTGHVSSLTLFNASASLPLDPAYSTNSWSNSLWWTPGGETPISFAFETGHAGNPTVPENNDFGGCSPGAPPPTLANGAVPCPSYDPGDWANDTLTPWEIAPPTFFNSAARVTATQVGFSQDLGGLAFIDGSDVFGSFAYTCLGHETSAYCSYPWYSYSCAEGAFNFGATDYGTSPTTVDFGKSTEFNAKLTTDAAGLGYYAPDNHSIPSCGAPSGTVTVAAGGSGETVSFLNRTVASGIDTFSNVTDGNYSLAAWVPSGDVFAGWVTSLGAAVSNAADPFTNLLVSGTGGTVIATVSAAASPGLVTNVTFDSATSGATVSFVPGFASSQFGDGWVNGTQELANGTTLTLGAGLYSVQAQPPPGYNFTGWYTSNPSVATFSAPGFPATILDVLHGGANVTISATYAATTASATVILFTLAPGDTITLNGTPYSGFSVATLPVGTYPLSYQAGPGARFQTWSGGGSEIITNFSASTWVTFEEGDSELEAVDYAIQQVTLDDGGPLNGTIAWNPVANLSTVAVANGTTLSVNISELTFPGFPLAATPAPGNVFTSWTVNNSSLAYVQNPLDFSTEVIFNSTGITPLTITAVFGKSAGATLAVQTVPAAGGNLTVGFSAPVGNGTSLPVATGEVTVVAWPNSGYVVSGLTVDNGSTALLVRSATTTTRPWAPSEWTVDVAGDTQLNVTFAPLLHPVTFVADWAGTTSHARIASTNVSQDGTVWLANGTYSVTAALGAGITFLTWSPSWGFLNASSPLTLTTNVTVTGPGTLYALGSVNTSSIVVFADLSTTGAQLLPGGTLNVSATAYCLDDTPCPPGVTFNWTLTNDSVGALNATTGSMVRFTAAEVYATTGLSVNATLNGTTAESAIAPISVVPALTGATVTPTNVTVFAGESVGFSVNETCTDGIACPPGTVLSATLFDPSLGFLSSNATYPVTFTSYPGEVGTEDVLVNVSLDGVTLTPATVVNVVLPLLTNVAIGPSSLTTAEGTTGNFSATPTCSNGLGCPSGTVFTWSLAPDTLGALSATTGASVEFTAGASAGAGTLDVSGTLNNVTVAASSVPITVTTSTVVATLVAVTITPATLSVAVGALGQFSAALACSPAPCPSAVSVAWSVTGNVGTLSNPTGTTTNLTGAFAGQGQLYANATWNGKTISAIPASVTVTSNGGTNSSNTPLYENPLLWVALVVVVVVVIAAVLLMRRGPSATPPPTSPTGAPSSETAPGDAPATK